MQLIRLQSGKIAAVGLWETPDERQEIEQTYPVTTDNQIAIFTQEAFIESLATVLDREGMQFLLQAMDKTKNSS